MCNRDTKAPEDKSLLHLQLYNLSIYSVMRNNHTRDLFQNCLGGGGVVSKSVEGKRFAMGTLSGFCVHGLIILIFLFVYTGKYS